MDKLVTGVRKFKKHHYLDKKELFEVLANGQSPEALFITCSDSRIDPNLITQTEPGDLFICRNAGNIVPPHSLNTGGTTASIEFAVTALKVPNIIVCGHTDCGAMKGAMHPESLGKLPHVSNWLNHCQSALSTVKGRHGGEIDHDYLNELTEENVLQQMKHLETHPSVAERLAAGTIEIHGWIYHIGDGHVSCYHDDVKAFVSIEDRYAEILHRIPEQEHQSA
ncbi:MAG: carbonic anhydrase [Pseudohongiellaceae bacterium]